MPSEDKLPEVKAPDAVIQPNPYMNDVASIASPIVSTTGLANKPIPEIIDQYSTLSFDARHQTFRSSPMETFSRFLKEWGLYDYMYVDFTKYSGPNVYITRSWAGEAPFFDINKSYVRIRMTTPATPKEYFAGIAFELPKPINAGTNIKSLIALVNYDCNADVSSCGVTFWCNTPPTQFGTINQNSITAYTGGIAKTVNGIVTNLSTDTAISLPRQQAVFFCSTITRHNIAISGINRVLYARYYPNYPYPNDANLQQFTHIGWYVGVFENKTGIMNVYSPIIIGYNF